MGVEGESCTLVVGVGWLGAGVATTAAGKAMILSWETRSARSVEDRGGEWVELGVGGGQRP